ncbi:acyl-CoA dehydrogenase family protein [Dactylosporangium sp. CA-092794]|uniref:acyl-CoA dehydrogenase family protein n=1 Tax=Dactylosporangium sp. CA-092794 TaxID=3239929 RepID=UPI003D90515D
MNFELSETQLQISGLARTVLGPRSLSQGTPSRLPRTEEFFDRETWSLLARTDLLGLGALPEEDGGGYPAVCCLLVETGRAAARVPAVECLLPALAIVQHGTAAQQSLVDAVAAGQTLLALALHEEGAYGPADLTTSARPDGYGWLLDGARTDVGYARDADRLLVPARVGSGGCVLLLVDPAAPGVHLTDLETSTNQPSCVARFDGVAVPHAQVVGGTALPAGVLETLWLQAATAVCALQLGLMEGAVAMTVEHLRTRKQFGRELATFQAVAMQAADVHIAVEAARLTFWEAVWRLSTGRPAAAEVAIAKYWAAASSAKVMTAAQHLHGGMGVDTDHPMHAYVLWSLAWQRQFGSASSQLFDLGELIAKQRTVAS